MCDQGPQGKYVAMRLRSTGLGRTELEAEVISIKKVGDLVTFFVNTIQPVKLKWRTRRTSWLRRLKGIAFIPLFEELRQM
jgi:hypothetical protein